MTKGEGRFGRGGRFRYGVVAGVLLVAVMGRLINDTSVADHIVEPLFVADSTGPVDAVVVLGAGVIGDCVPNQHGMRRVLMAVRHWRQHPGARMLFTGGTGEPCPVAKAMAGLAAELGVPAVQIHAETASANTRENAVLATALLRAWGVSKVLVVTDRLHMRRAVGAFARAGLPIQRASVPIYEGHEDNVSMLAAGLREYAALAYYRLRGWTGDLGADAPPPMTMTTPVTPAAPGDGPIVLLGASYAASWPLTEVSGIAVVNKGVAGQQSFELLERFDTDVTALAPRAVILWGFINDIFRASDVDAAVARIKDSYTQMILQARAAGIVPVLATEVTARPTNRGITDRLLNLVGSLTGKRAYQDSINEHVLAVNDWILDTARREGLLVLHLQQVTSEPGERRLPAFAQADGSHITPAGYDHMTSYARPVLQEFLVVR